MLYKFRELKVSAYMRFIIIFIIFLLIISCSNESASKKEVVQTKPDTSLVKKGISDEDIKASDRKKNQKFPVLTDSSDIDALTYHLKQLNKLRQNTSLRDSINPMVWELCPKYYEIIRNQRAQRAVEFRKIFETLEPRHQGNYAFVEKVINEESDTTKLAYEKPLAPVFRGVTKSISVFEPDRRSIAESKFFEQIRNDSNLVTTDISILEDHYSYPYSESFAGFDSVFVFTQKGKYRAAVKDFNFKLGTCISYYNYELKGLNGNLEKGERILLSSAYDLDLIYTSNPEVDQALIKRSPNVCLDCPNSERFQKTFAKLKGFDNFYFTYTQELNKEIDETDVPVRSLVYFKDGFLYTIWKKDIDLFGCSCL